MDTKELTLVSDSPEFNQLAAIRTRIDFYKEHFHPYLREDLNLHHLSVITNFPRSDIEIFLIQTPQPFNQYLDEWRVKYAKNLITREKYGERKLKPLVPYQAFLRPGICRSLSKY